MSEFWKSISMAHDGSDASWQILIMLVVAFILGYLLRFFISSAKYGKLKEQYDEMKSSNERLRDQLDKQKKDLEKVVDPSPLRSEIAVLKRTNSQLNKELEDCRNRSEELAAPVVNKPPVTSDPVVMAGLAPPVKPLSATAAVDPDDLTKIEGVGKKIQEHLNNGGIRTFNELASSPVERLQEILDAAGPAYTMHDPETWPEQGALARDGKWEQLSTWQAQLKGGRKRKKR